MSLLSLNMIRKTAISLAFFAVLVAVFWLLPTTALAQASLGIEDATQTGLGTADIRLIITRIIQIVLGFLGIMALAIVLYGGYVWMTSGGNEEKISQAKKILVNGAIGLVIILSAFTIVSFIINAISDATHNQPGGGSGGGGTINPPSLGGGILQNVYPAPGAVDVPRNTLIMVAYAVEMDIASIIDTDSNPAQCQNLPAETTCGYLRVVNNIPTTRIINQTDNDEALSANEVIVMTNDGRNFVYDPIEYLGNDNTNTYYAVNLTDLIDKADGAAAFLIGGYQWSFQVSNYLDVTPPKVISVIPASPPAVPMNTTLQINFDEAVNVITATGYATGNPDEPFNNILISYDDNGSNVYLSGEAIISNQFRTVEFISDIQCEINGQPVINSCGEVPTCFPASEDFNVLIKAAELGNLFTGIVDAAGNSLDGNANGLAEGPPTDNYYHQFSTSAELDLTPPEVIAPLDPEQSDPTTPKNKKLKAIFNEYLLSSTVNSSNYKVFKYACPAVNGFPLDETCYPEGGFIVYQENFNNNQEINNGNPASRAVLQTYHPYLNGLTQYNARLTSGIKDLYQNCFNPAVGVCAPGQESPNCN